MAPHRSANLEVDFEALEPVRVDGHAVAVRCDREHLLALGDGGARFRLNGASDLREHERRQIVEIGRAEAQVASRQVAGANRKRAGEPRRSEAERKIVDRPAAVVVLGDMRRALQRIAVHVSGQGGSRVDQAGYVIGKRFERDAGCLAVEELSLAQVGLERGGEIGRRAAQRGGDLRLAAHTRVKDLRLRDLNARAEIHLVAPILAVEPGGPVLAARQQISEAEPAPGREPRRAGQVERSAGRPVEHRKVRGEFRRMRVDGRAQRAIAGSAIQIGGDTRLAFERTPGKQREPAEVAGDDVRFAHEFSRPRASRNIAR